MPPGKRTLLLTLDAFETLFHPIRPVHEQYASVARKFNFPAGSPITPEKVQSAFKEVFKAQAARRPNYGRDAALKGEYGGPRQWWEEIIRGTFAKALHPSDPEASKEVQVPAKLVDTLLDRFAGNQGYALYDDVQAFLRGMNAYKMSGGGGAFDKILVGVLSNSDDRVPLILRSLGLRVGIGRALEFADVTGRLPGFENITAHDHAALPTTPGDGPSSDPDHQSLSGRKPNDLDLVVMSYQAGAEKPSPAIFRAAERTAVALIGDRHAAVGCVWVHVGDDYYKDYRAARDAGWDAYFLDRTGKGRGGALGEREGVGEVKTIRSLLDLIKTLEREYPGKGSSTESVKLPETNVAQ